MENKIEENQLIEFLKMLNDLTTSFPDILNNYFDENGLKKEYRNERYYQLVLIDKTIKNNLEVIADKFNILKNEQKDDEIKQFILIAWDSVDKLLKECADFSLLFYTLTIDVMLSLSKTSAIDDSTLLTDAQNLVAKYYMFVEKIEDYKIQITKFSNYYYD